MKGGIIISISRTFAVLKDPVRREILEFLKSGKKSAGVIADQFDLTKATISYHLQKLKEADLIFETKEKNFIYYEINLSVIEEFMMWFSQFDSLDSQKKKGGK